MQNIVVTAIQGLIDAADEQLYKRDNSQDENKVSTEINRKLQILSSFVGLVLFFGCVFHVYMEVTPQKKEQQKLSLYADKLSCSKKNFPTL